MERKTNTKSKIKINKKKIQKNATFFLVLPLCLISQYRKREYTHEHLSDGYQG